MLPGAGYVAVRDGSRESVTRNPTTPTAMNVFLAMRGNRKVTLWLAVRRTSARHDRPVAGSRMEAGAEAGVISWSGSATERTSWRTPPVLGA